MSVRLHIHLLGGFQLTYNERQVTGLHQARQQSLLGYLLLHADAPQSRQHLAFLFWPDSTEGQARANLRYLLHQLRKGFPELERYLHIDRKSVRWRADAAFYLDVAEFEGALARAEQGADAEAIRSDLEQAAQLYRGDLLPDCYDEWVLAGRERLSQRYIAGLERLVGLLAQGGDTPGAIRYAQRLLRYDPLHEAAYRRLMGLYALSGDRARALSVYHTCVTILAQELGVEPGPSTREAYERILNQDAGPVAVETPAPSTTAPDVMPRLIGRQTEWGRLQAAWQGDEDAVVRGVDELSVLERIGRGRMVGREGEFGRARALWNRTLSGQGQTLLVSGDPGIGKTRLVQELVTQVRVAGATALVGACYAEGGGPYAPFTQILRRAFRDGAGGDLGLPAFVLADLRTIAPALRLRFPDIPPNPPLYPEAEQQRLFESVIAFCIALSERAPLLLVLEDAHWADSDTLFLFRHLARRAQRHRMMLVTTYRELELDSTQPLQQVRLDLSREGLATHLNLTQLDYAQAGQLLATLFDEEITPGFLDSIYHKTEGNPFFMVEVCKALVESGELYYAEGRWNRRTAGDLQIPPSVRLAIQSRVAKLSNEAQDALRLAAVIGREFDFDTLEKASQRDEETLIAALEAAERAQLIEEVNGQETVTFTFAHALIPDTLYESVGTLRRRRLHRSVAMAIEVIYPDDESHLASLAHHYAEAGDQERARRYNVRAGDHARRSVAWADAVGHYRAALECWPDAEQPARAETLRRLLECLSMTGNLREALQVYEESHAVFEIVGDRDGSGAVQRLMGRIYYELGQRDASLTHYHNALSILEDGSESVELARAISEISRMHMVTAEYDEAVAVGERALALAERLGAQDVTVHALNNIGVSLAPRDPERGFAMLQDSLRRALALGLPYDACRAYSNLGSAFQKQCRYSEARATYIDLLTYAERVGAAPFVVSPLGEIARVDWLSGQWAAALARRAQILEWVTSSSSSSMHEIRASTLFGRMLIDLGQAEAARAELESRLSEARSIAVPHTTVPHLGQLARAFAELGMESEAAAAVQEMIGWIGGFSYVHIAEVMSLLHLCQWSAARAGDEAVLFLQRLERAHEKWNTPESDACLSEGRGSVALAEGDYDEAVGFLRRAVARWEEIGRPYDQARALSGLGCALVGGDDPTSARAAFDRALEITDSLAAQLDDAELKRSFLNSQPVREMREARATGS